MKTTRETCTLKLTLTSPSAIGALKDLAAARGQPAAVIVENIVFEAWEREQGIKFSIEPQRNDVAALAYLASIKGTSVIATLREFVDSDRFSQALHEEMAAVAAR